MTPEQLAKLWHNTYQTLAPEFCYGFMISDFDKDSESGKLEIAVARRVLQKLEEE